jgi:hypothetical protein
MWAALYGTTTACPATRRNVHAPQTPRPPASVPVLLSGLRAAMAEPGRRPPRCSSMLLSRLRGDARPSSAGAGRTARPSLPSWLAHASAPAGGCRGAWSARPLPTWTASPFLAARAGTHHQRQDVDAAAAAARAEGRGQLGAQAGNLKQQVLLRAGGGGGGRPRRGPQALGAASVAGQRAGQPVRQAFQSL